MVFSDFFTRVDGATLQLAENYLERSKRIAETVNTTTNIQEYFDQYDALVKALNDLVSVSGGIDFQGEKPEIMLKRVDGEEQRSASRSALILRCFKQTVQEIEATGSIEKRLLVSENFGSSFTPFLKAFSEKERREISGYKQLLLDTYITPLQKAWRERILALQERQRKQEAEEQLKRERAAAEFRRKQKEIAQEVIAKNQRVQQEQRAQQELYRRQRTEKLRGLSDAELLKDAIRFASTQFYITTEEMELEYPTLSTQERNQLLLKLAQIGAVQSRPGADSWLSLVDQEKSKQLIENLSEKLDGKEITNLSMDQMDGQTFEHFCADLLQSSGFSNVEVTQASGDFGIDILAQKDGVTYGIQCKCYSDTVGNHAVQEALSGAQYYHCMVAVVMTNNYFTQAAVETAKRTNVLLWDRDKVLEMVNG